MESQSPYQIERLETLAQLDALESEWRALIAEVPDAPVFLTWEWIRTWWEHFHRNRDLWLLTARDSQGCLVGIAPLVMEPSGRMGLRKIGFIGVGLVYSVHLNFLLHPSDSQGILHGFFQFLKEHSSQWDALQLQTVAQGSPLYSGTAAAGGAFHTGEMKVSAYVPLPDHWETYAKTLTKKLRRNLKYFRSKLEQDHPGQICLRQVTVSGELPEVMRRLTELNRGRWHSKDRASNFDDPDFVAFHQAIARLVFERGWLRLNLLTVSDQPIAICYNFLFHNRVYAYAIGYDQEWSRYSPGRLAIAYSIQEAIREGAREYDWLGGDEPYKLAWTDQVRVETDILYSRNLRGGIWVIWQSSRAHLHETAVVKARQWIPKPARDRVNQWLAPRYQPGEEREEKEAA